MTAHVKLTGSWSNVSDIYSRVGGSWKQVTEGYVKLSGAWKQFFSSGTALTVNYLVIAGGGGGGGSTGGGGGAGGYRTSVGTSGGGGSAESALTLAVATNYTVTVGAGGAGGGNALNGSAGANSVFSSVTSNGGGQGKGTNSTASGFSGGSGGGSAIFQGSTGTSAGGAGTTNQGFKGGDVEQQTGVYGGSGGGGGAGAAALTSTQASPGSNGGAGLSNSITGTAITRGGGGGAGEFGKSGGSGGGGNGSADPSTAATAGSANTGGGGGGGNYRNVTSGAAGGSGIVIIKYPDFYAISVTAGLTHSTVTSGGFRVTTFTAGTGTVSFSQAVANDYVLIGTTYLTSSQASVTFDLTGLSGTYKHLQIRAVAKTDRAATNDNIILRFNGDSGTNYSCHNLRGSSGSVTSGANTNETKVICRAIGGNDGNFGAVVIDILDPFETTKFKTVRSFGGYATDIVELGSGNWRNTGAITSILLDQDVGSNFLANSRFSIYGIKG
jgi:hypothetical protein